MLARIMPNHFLKFSLRKAQELISTGQVNPALPGNKYRPSLLPMAWKGKDFLITCQPPGSITNSNWRKQQVAKVIPACWQQLLLMSLLIIPFLHMELRGRILKTRSIQENIPMMVWEGHSKHLNQALTIAFFVTQISC